MVKRMVFVLLLAFLPAACVGNAIPLGPGVTQAKADLHAAEVRFASAQAAIIRLAQAGVLKGDVLVKVKQAEATAHVAIRVARTAVDAGKADMLSAVSTSLVAVLELVAIYTGGK